jgi:hypothetical protein
MENNGWNGDSRDISRGAARVEGRSFRRIFRFLIPLLFSLLLLPVLAACAGQTPAAAQPALAPLSEMSDRVKAAPVVVQEAYRFAVANSDVMKEIPCYCGCGAMGHHSNYNCYVKSVDDSGRIIFDNHALGCTLCVDITRDTMRLQQEGKSTADIRAIIDQTYRSYGSPTQP